MDTTILLGLFLGIVGLILLGIFSVEYRIRRPDSVVVYELKGRIGIRKGLFYPRHFSLALKHAPHPFQLSMEASAKGNLGVRVKLAGAFVPSLEHIQTLIRVGGWEVDAVERAASQAQIILEGLVKEYTERCEIHALSSADLLIYLNKHADGIREKFGLGLVSLSVQLLEPTDAEIIDALRQQEQARLLEATERLRHRARIAAAKAKYQADEEIAQMEHALELKKAEMEKARLEEEAALAHQRLEDELKRSRMRLAFEREELDVLRSSPELLLLTPQAARLAEASQGLKNARTVISLAPQELAPGSELFNLFRAWLQKALEAKDTDNVT